MEGWIRLSRSIQDHWLWEDEPFDKARAWIDLLMLANYEDKKIAYKGEIITCKRGDVNLSLLYLADRWKWSTWKVRNFIDLLEKDEMITTNRTTHRTTITIVNYGFYQDLPTTKRTTKHTTDQTTNHQQTTTTKEINKDNNILSNDNIRHFESELVESAFQEFVEYRNKSFKPKMSEKAISLSVNTLKKLSGGNETKAIAIINQSIENGWKGLFDLKSDYKSGIKQNTFNQMIHTDYDFEALEKEILK